MCDTGTPGPAQPRSQHEAARPARSSGANPTVTSSLDCAQLSRGELEARLRDAEHRAQELELCLVQAESARRLEERLHRVASARCLLWYAEVEEIGKERLRWDVHFPSEEAARRFLPVTIGEGQRFVDAWYLSRPTEDQQRSDRFGAAEVRAGRDYSQQYRCRLADGSVRWLQEDVSVEVVEEGRRWRAVGVCVDITDRKDAEDSLAWTMKAAGVGWFGVSMLHDVAAVSSEYAAMIGAAVEDIATRQALHARVHPDDLKRLESVRAEACVRRDDSLPVPDIRVRHADGSWRWHQITYRLTYREDGTPAWATGIAVDITERKDQERQVESLNARLRWAMNETHHRVKNNLQVIAAMIELQAENYEDFVPLHEIRTLSQHVRGLAAIHELLTEQSKAGGSVNTLSARAALRKMLPTLEATLAGRQIRMDLAEFSVPSRQATALAIIVNELVANAIKHGRGDIVLSLTAEEGTARLVVQDEGRGFPEGFDPETAAHTGLELVLMLARWDLGGAIEFGNARGGGACVRVQFAVAPPPGE